MISGSHGLPVEGQYITYTCPRGFALTGPNISVCTGNGRWEPDPGQVDCIGDYLLLISTIQNVIMIIIMHTADYEIPLVNSTVTTLHLGIYCTHKHGIQNLKILGLSLYLVRMAAM